MAKFQAQVPHSLCHKLSALLPPGRMTAPAIRVDLLIFIKECRFKGPAMQIQLNDVSSGERSLRQSGEEEFIDDAFPRDAHRTLLEALGVGSHHYATHDALRAYR